MLLLKNIIQNRRIIMKDEEKQKQYEKMSKPELLKELKELQSDFDFIDYNSWYEEGYWLDFVIDLIIDEKIDSRYWAKRMPQVNPYPALIEKFIERLENKYLNLTDEELEKANNQRNEKEEEDDGKVKSLRDLLRTRTEEIH